MNSSEETARRRLIRDLVAKQPREPSAISTTVLAEAKTEWRSAEQSYHRSLIFVAAIYVLVELASAGLGPELPILGIQNIDPRFYLRLAPVLLAAGFYWSCISYILAIKMSAIHYELAREIHPALSYERLYEAMVTPSILTRGTMTSEVVDKPRPRNGLAEFVQEAIPNLIGFFIIPLIIGLLIARAFWIEIDAFGFDLWVGLSLGVAVALMVLAVVRFVVELSEAVDDYDMPEFEESDVDTH